MADMKHGFGIGRIVCSGCSFDESHFFMDGNPFESLKEVLVGKVLIAHDKYRPQGDYKCSGGKIRIDYHPAILVSLDKKP